uniref:MSP domain-containing protein n=1 Tax=Anopheles farauti TaxID=69004 RepID=A0A182QBL4_9DIPT
MKSVIFFSNTMCFPFRYHPSIPQVHFANLSPPESPMLENANTTFPEHSEGEMLRIRPQNTITFSKAGNDLVGSVEITNVDTREVSFKVKTTAPEKFRVRPSTGVLQPSATVTINVMLQHGQQIQTINREKFLVMCIGLPSDSSTNTQDLADLWKNINSRSATVEQHRLKCALPVNFDESGLESMFSSGGNVAAGPDQYGVMSGSYAGSNMIGMSADKQMAILQQNISHLNDTTHRLEGQVKRNYRFQWVMCGLCVMLAIMVIYMLKIEIHNSATQYCSTTAGGHH